MMQPITLAEWDAMSLADRASMMRAHKPSAEAMRWADAQIDVVQSARQSGSAFISLDVFRRRASSVT
jgi:hypothetical protein